MRRPSALSVRSINGMRVSYMRSRREITSIVTEFGITIDSIRNKNHWVVFGTYEGKPIKVVLSKTPSCRRSLMNERTQIKHMIAALGETK